MTLREFAIKHLMPESVSTNPSHRKLLAGEMLDKVQFRLTDEQWVKCHRFIFENFDESFLNDSIVEDE